MCAGCDEIYERAGKRLGVPPQIIKTVVLVVQEEQEVSRAVRDFEERGIAAIGLPDIENPN